MAIDRDLSAIRARVQKNCDNDSVFFPNSEVDQFINEAFNNLAEDSQVNETSSDTTTTSGTYLYSIPSNCIQITEVTYDNELLDKREKEFILGLYDSNSTPSDKTGTPSAWSYESLTQIRLYPTPDAAKTLTIYYTSYPTELTDDTDESTFLKRADQYAEFYATKRCALMDKEMGVASYYERLEKEAWKRFIQIQKKKPQYMDDKNVYGQETNY